MKFLLCSCVALCCINVLADDDKRIQSPKELENKPGEKSNAFEPDVYADISEAAKQNAVSFGGIRGIFGIAISLQKYNASIGNKGAATGNSINSFGLCFGVEYLKACRKNLLFGATILTDIFQKGKIEGDWKKINASYDEQMMDAGARIGKLESAMITPSIFLKGGYHFKKQKLAVFLKAGMSRISGSYNYFLNGEKKCDVTMNAICPMIGIALEYKINKKWGVSADLELPIKKNFKKEKDNIEHKIKAGAINFRVVGTLLMRKQDN
ncbi:MAG: hypothetical protein LBD81_01555 [Holosporaceae bacterium]|jgi:hypothetical protein|nr:hypothetical protein [Holosporaceae bacterium]